MLAVVLTAAIAPAQTPDVIVVDASAPAHPFPHFWEQMFGSGRAVLSLRDSYRQDMREVKQITDFHYVRFHAVFHDEFGIYDEDTQGTPVYNFSYLDQSYDGLLANGVRPFVELSFMPKKLAAKEILHAFWYKQNVSPPKDYAKWDDLITQFAKHLVERYGIDLISNPIITVAEQHRQEGPNLWERDPDRCCEIRKVQPLLAALDPYDAWISGIRRDQSPSRAETPKLQWSERYAVWTVHPLADWDEKRIWAYIHVNEIPFNPLHETGYRSIGCIPCTRPVAPDEEERAGRWAGSDKLECGIHVERT